MGRSIAAPYTTRQKLSDRRIQRAALRPLWTALAKRESSPVDILCLGDSLTEGAYVSTIEKRWVARLRDKLRAAYPTSGVTGGQGFICANYHTIGPGNPGVEVNQVMTQVGGSTDPGYTLGLGRRYRKFTTTGNVSVTVTCSSVDAIYTQGTSRGTLGLAIDGGAAATVSTAGGLQASKKFSSGALTPGSHGVTVSWQSGGEVDVEGIMVYNGDETKGIRLWEGGHGGVESDFFTGGFWQTGIKTIAPALVIIELGVNDLMFSTGANYPSSKIAANIQATISAIRAQCDTAAIPYPSFLLLIAHQPAGSYNEPWSNYVTALWSVALADSGVAVLDMTDLLGLADTASGLFASDLIHLSDLGGEFYANAIMGAIAP